ncbi:ABC transporter ATP-binding protein/permease [Flavobacteriaceae bacterium]|nr:ABC transporter ATP-binding protein/permease [Flavobacteriaceae bacterium]
MKSNLKKIDFVIGKKYRGKIIFLVILILIGMFLEIMGLGSLIPLLSLISSPESLNQISIINYSNYLSNLDYNGIILFTLVIVVFLYIFKSLFLSYLTYRQNRFLANVNANISDRLFLMYINQPFGYHANNNSSELIKNLQTEVKMFGVYHTAIISVIVEIGLFLSVLFTLILVEPVGAVTVGGFLAGLAFLFFTYSKKKLTNWGTIRTEVETKISKNLFETFGGIKEVKLFNVDSYFYSMYSKNNAIRSDVTSYSNTLNQLPRFYLELISVFGLTLFIGIMLLQGKDVPTLIATIGVFVAAVFRLIPSINKIITAFQNLKYHNSSVNIIYNEFLNLSKNHKPKTKINFSLKNKLLISGLTFKYNNDSNFILDNINLEIISGETIGIIGGSGQGKSTFINLICGLYKPLKGIILSDKKNIADDIFSWNKIIGYVPQEVFIIDDTIENNILFGRDKNVANNDSLHKAIKLAQLDEFTQNLPMGLKTKIGERGAQISGGQKQRIGIARALYYDPPLLIFDEATSSLDFKTEDLIMNSIYSLKGRTKIIISHRQSTLKECDKVYEIKNSIIRLIK